MKTKVAIIDLGAWRSPFCKVELPSMRGQFNGLSAHDLGTLGVKQAVISLHRLGAEKKDLGKIISRVVGSVVGIPAEAPNPARIISVRGGLPVEIPSDTFSKNCASGIAAINYAANQILLGEDDGVLVVGFESMSNNPLMISSVLRKKFLKAASMKGLLKQLPTLLGIYADLWKMPLPNFRKTHGPVIGLEVGLNDILCDLMMGSTAENLAKDPALEITREDQDFYAYISHKRAATAKEFLKEQIYPVLAPTRGGFSWVKEDDGIDHDISLEKLAKRRPSFDREYGSIHGGNSSQITDGEAHVLLMDERKAKAFGLPIKGYVGDYADCGVDPSRMGLGPVGALLKLWETKAGARPSEYDAIELSAAFASVVLACSKIMGSKALMNQFFDHNYPLELDTLDNKVNSWGDYICFGHPVGASAIRAYINGIERAKACGGESSVTAVCIGGGQGAALEGFAAL